MTGANAKPPFDWEGALIYALVICMAGLLANAAFGIVSIPCVSM